MENSYKDYVKKEIRRTNLKIGLIIGASLLLAFFAMGVGFGFINIGQAGISFAF